MFHPPPPDDKFFELLHYTPKTISIVLRSRGKKKYRLCQLCHDLANFCREATGLSWRRSLLATSEKNEPWIFHSLRKIFVRIFNRKTGWKTIWEILEKNKPSKWSGNTLSASDDWCSVRFESVLIDSRVYWSIRESAFRCECVWIETGESYKVPLNSTNSYSIWLSVARLQ